MPRSGALQKATPGKPATIAAVSSVDPPSTTMCSTHTWVCARTRSSVARRVRAPLRTGVTTVTSAASATSDHVVRAQLPAVAPPADGGRRQHAERRQRPAEPGMEAYQWAAAERPREVAAQEAPERVRPAEPAAAQHLLGLRAIGVHVMGGLLVAVLAEAGDRRRHR